MKTLLVSKQDVLDRKIKFNVSAFIKSRVTPKIYFKYFYEEPPIQKEFNFSNIQLPKVNSRFV